MGRLQFLWMLAVFGVQRIGAQFCEDYIRCMEQLEIKQHECLALDKNVRLRSSDACSRQKWDKKLELNALHMRRAEVARDCVRKNHLDATIAESTLDEDARKQCNSLHEKFRFAKNFTSFADDVTSSTATSSNRKKRAAKRNKREVRKNSNTKATECRNAAKLWHKQCSALAKCCPLTDECKQSTLGIMDQIYEGRHKLQEMHVNNCV
ncbi:unnamed protein product [Caenorhabditis sp. 36 PRJEB53466]|nr:unnamed protein product [Caenorhabditis sp. 36 PRJEB53466]